MDAHIMGKDLKENQPTTLLLCGKAYELSMDFNVICEMEDRYGTFEKAGAALSGGKMKDVRFLLYAMLKQSDESLTEKAVGHMINMQNMQEVMNKVGEAMKSSAPQADEKNGKNPPEA